MSLNHMVAVIGAGPAGLFASRKLAEAGVRVALLNRDIKPGGLAEYGIYPDKYKMKQGLRTQFAQILKYPNLEYFGNVTVCSSESLSLEDLLASGFHAVLVTTGAQGTKWLRLPGENLPGVYHAKNIVFHYNKLPPFSQKKYLIGQRVALVGAGNVMLDIAHYLVRERKVEEVIIVVRRGPFEVKFSRKEMEYVAANLDLEALDAELERIRPHLEAIGQDPQKARALLTESLPKALPRVSETRLRFEFLSSPVRIMGDWMNGVSGLKVEENKLVLQDGAVKARGTGVSRIIPADTVIFAIGDTVDRNFCLPVYNDGYAVSPTPRFPVDGISFEAYDYETGRPLEGIFLAGWARQASYGLVGYARKDGELAATAILHYLQTLPAPTDVEEKFARFCNRLMETHSRVITKGILERLEKAEQEEARRRNLPLFKFETNEEMFAAVGLSQRE
ncbi:MAG: FAD-dependent oxidoreductase [Anaerolineales bacterium]|nr:FAD-dependent oxidoreductase [Anaerolineales bacterium]